jgi:ribosomal protein L13
MMSKTSYFTKESRERPWYVVDLDGQVLGRAAAAIASLLIGKTQPQYTPGQDTGGFVIAINAAKIRSAIRPNKVYWTQRFAAASRARYTARSSPSRPK